MTGICEMETRLDYLRTLGKEIDMRTGNVFFLLILVLMGFGFLLYYSIDLTMELSATRNQLVQAQADMQALEMQYQTVVVENERLNRQITELTEKNASIQSQQITLETERNKLLWQIETLQSDLAFFEETYSILAWLNSSQTFRLATIFMVPIIPISLGVIYVTKRHKAPTSVLLRNKLLNNELHSIENRQRTLQILSRLPKRNANLIDK